MPDGHHKKKTSHDEKLGIFSPTSSSLWKGEGLKVQLMIHLAHLMKPHEIPIVGGSESIWAGEHVEVLGEGRDTQTPSPTHLSPCASSIRMLTYIPYILFITNQYM